MADILCACEEEGLAPPVTSQPFANAIAGYDDEESALMARDAGMTILAHSPLHKGMLSEAMIDAAGQYIKDREELGDNGEELAAFKEGLDILSGLSKKALEAGHNLARLGIAWSVMLPDAVALSSPTNQSRLEDVKEGANWQLDDATMDAISAAQARFRELNFVNMSANLMRAMRVYYR
jgi:aryl-alcohol dehydrogenase-like predicted oxidoreductase